MASGSNCGINSGRYLKKVIASSNGRFHDTKLPRRVVEMRLRRTIAAESVYGTFETCRPTLRMSANRARPEVAGAGQRDAIDPTQTSNLIAFCGRMLSLPATYRPGPLGA